MIVVADTSPVTYLVQLSLEHLLHELYGGLILPDRVVQELCHERTPEIVRLWAQRPPSWIRVLSEGVVDRPELKALDAGESAAITVAMKVKADVLLIDEKKGARVADSLGLRVTRTLGVLRDGEAAGLVDAVDAYRRLSQETTFRQNGKLYDQFLRSLNRR